MKKIHLVVLILTILTLVEGIYYLQLKGVSLTTVLQKIPNTGNETPIKEYKDELNITFQDKQDKVGRTAIYNQAAFNAFNGTGKISGDANTLTAYVGKFAGFETILDSEDEYLLVEDPKTGELLVKGRIDYSSEHDETDFKVENLARTNTNVSTVENLGLSVDLGKETIKKLIQKGDVLTAMLLPQENDFSQAQLDTEGNPFFLRIILRRFDGKHQIQKEL
ncbi:hypothetical protein COW99_02750 [Candidatus Roizmanbacteria bacterium CG22_combo_CG10-13_8_21_14_all_38_20]|uniref:Uncharacterized protein n=1 Tax=Candidatus Roizmanbacteria bacterium CG22_combo_CG10-13_8_21_14_all_38_20 TaxID=1974862 RepID=A0A2H0BVF2_9BACT|nr:MAG: hypothetical protein COW99_02750 [Candidatus Roizmanbacteria bacterium CG22_combo_CG10-13_8_21_14_all_38_20]PJC31371.1 MAG: hypothetical protein CO050_03290 [Candidatus Roizmanbacteria bacterium CG_4_9_14_0_2_um_filter_38_17]